MHDLLKKLVGNQYLEVLRTLVSTEILVPLTISAIFLRGTTCVQLINFKDPIHENDLDIYDPLTVSNFRKKSPQNKYICVAT